MTLVQQLQKCDQDGMVFLGPVVHRPVYHFLDELHDEGLKQLGEMEYDSIPLKNAAVLLRAVGYTRGGIVVTTADFARQHGLN